MKKKDYDAFDSIDDYYEDDLGPNLFSQAVATDAGDVSYEEFNQTTDDDNEASQTKIVTTKKVSKKRKEEEEEEYQDGWVDILSFFWTWFRRIGIVIAVILSAYYLTQGLLKDLFLYLLLLVLAFGFGYGFMAFINTIMGDR